MDLGSHAWLANPPDENEASITIVGQSFQYKQCPVGQVSYPWSPALSSILVSEMASPDLDFRF